MGQIHESSLILGVWPVNASWGVHQPRMDRAGCLTSLAKNGGAPDVLGTQLVCRLISLGYRVQHNFGCGNVVLTAIP